MTYSLLEVGERRLLRSCALAPGTACVPTRRVQRGTRGRRDRRRYAFERPAADRGGPRRPHPSGRQRYPVARVMVLLSSGRPGMSVRDGAGGPRTQAAPDRHLRRGVKPLPLWPRGAACRGHVQEVARCWHACVPTRMRMGRAARRTRTRGNGWHVGRLNASRRPTRRSAVCRPSGRRGGTHRRRRPQRRRRREGRGSGGTARCATGGCGRGPGPLVSVRGPTGC